MATTHANITIQKGVWTNLYTASGIAVGTQVEVINKGSYACTVATGSTAPSVGVGFPLYAGSIGNTTEIAAGEAGLWAYVPDGATTLLVQEVSLQKYTAGSALVSSIHGKGMDFYTAVGLNLVPGCRRVAALGNNPSIDQATLPEDIWSGGGIYPWMTGATTLEIASLSSNDTAAGTGARTVLVNGLDINYAEISETVTLNGTSAVALTKTYFRINSALIMSAGSGKVNAGDLNIRDTGAGTIRAIIPAGYGITRQAVYTVPAGMTLSIHSQFLNINRANGGTRDVTLTNFIQSPLGYYRMPIEIDVDGNPYRHDAVPGIILAEKTDYAIRCVAASATTGTNVTAAILGMLFTNTLLASV